MLYNFSELLPSVVFFVFFLISLHQSANFFPNERMRSIDHMKGEHTSKNRHCCRKVRVMKGTPFPFYVHAPWQSAPFIPHTRAYLKRNTLWCTHTLIWLVNWSFILSVLLHVAFFTWPLVWLSYFFVNKGFQISIVYFGWFMLHGSFSHYCDCSTFFLNKVELCLFWEVSTFGFFYPLPSTWLADLKNYYISYLYI